MDTKWKKCKIWTGIITFCLGWSMLLHCLLTGAARLQYLQNNLSMLTENNYQETWEFRSFVEERLESFLSMATGGPVRNWNSYGAGYFDRSMYMQNGLYSYDTAIQIQDEWETSYYTDKEETNTIAAELGNEESDQIYSPEELEDILSSYGYQTEKREPTPEEKEYYKKQAQWFHQQIANDKNMLYIIQYDDKTLFTNADGTGLTGGTTPSLPDGYNFFLSFDGQKTRIIRDGQEIDIYGDGYYRESDKWFVPGYKNFTVDEETSKASIIIAVARSPMLYVNGAYASDGYGWSENPLYWIERNMADTRKSITGLLVRTGIALALLLLSALLKKDRKAGIRQISRFTGTIWFEIKLLVVTAAMIPSLFFCQNILNTFINLYDCGYGPYWNDIIYESIYELQYHPSSGITGAAILLFVLYLLAADFRYNKKTWQHGLFGKLFRQLNLKNLALPVQRQMMYPYVILTGLQFLLLIAALFLVAEIGNCYGYYSRLLPPYATLLCILLISMAATIFFTVRGRQTARDLGALTRQITAVKHGDLTHPANLSEDSVLAEAARDLIEIRQGLHTALDEQMKSERMKVELVSNVSHDIKTPLTSIISYVDLLNQEEELPEHIQDYVKILDDKSQRLKAMVQDVFEVSKAASGQLPVDMKQIDFGKLLRQTLADMEETIHNSNVSLKASIPETPIMICADGQRLYRVFQNLIQNALQYSLEGSRIYLTLTEQGGAALAMVKNISRNELDKNVDFTSRFTRGDNSRTDGGSGLGLSIAKSFTEACEGKFQVETDADLFTVTVIFAVVNNEEM